MALSGEDINTVVESLVHGAEERYIAELYDTAIDELRRGLEYSATVDLETLARAYPAKAMTILLKHKGEISDEVVAKVEEALRESAAADLVALDTVYGAAATVAAGAAVRGGLTKHFNDMSKQTAEGVRRIIERQNVLLATDLRAVWYKTVTECVSAVNQGLKPMDKVMAEGVEKLINAGITVVPQMASSRRTVTTQVDVALRRHLTTEMSQAAGRMSLEAMDLYGHDLVITSSHYGARESHSVWQGLPCCKSGTKTIDGETYPDMVSLTEYGSAAGLKGVNCRHMIFPYFPGISQLPDREFKAEQKKFGMTSNEYYEATQRQRVLERRVRDSKRQIAAMERAGLGYENPSYVNKRLVLGRQQKTLKDWCDSNNLVRLPERERAYGVATQPRALYAKRSFAYSNKGHKTMRLASLETFEKGYRGVRLDRVEYGMVFDKDWNDLYDKPTIGYEGHISMPLPEGYNNWSRLNVAHTHPNEYGGTFSLPDVTAFRECRPLSTSAVANEGTYTLAAIQGKKNRWVDFQNAFDSKYTSVTNHYLDELNRVCMKRGSHATHDEKKKVGEQVSRVMDRWLDENSKDYGFRYSFKKAR